MVGNSFSASNMRYMPKVAKAMGVRLDICSLFIPGCTLEMHWHNAEKESPAGSKPYICTRYVCAEAQPKQFVDLTEALAMDRWDIVTIQQGSHLSWRPESYRPWGDKLVAKIRELAPHAQIYFQETWSYTPWDRRLKEWGFGQDEMCERIHKAASGFASAHGFEVIPMGAAVQRFRRALPVRYSENSFGGDVCGGDKLPPDRQFEIGPDGKWRPALGTKDPVTKKMLGHCDVFHLNDDGCYLQALVWVAKLFNADVRNCPYVPKGMAPARAELMKKVAFETVSSASASAFGGARWIGPAEDLRQDADMGAAQWITAEPDKKGAVTLGYAFDVAGMPEGAVVEIVHAGISNCEITVNGRLFHRAWGQVQDWRRAGFRNMAPWLKEGRNEVSVRLSGAGEKAFIAKISCPDGRTLVTGPDGVEAEIRLPSAPVQLKGAGAWTFDVAAGTER